MAVTDENFNISKCPHCGQDPGHPVGEKCPKLPQRHLRPDGSVEDPQHPEPTPAQRQAAQDEAHPRLAEPTAPPVQQFPTIPAPQDTPAPRGKPDKDAE